MKIIRKLLMLFIVMLIISNLSYAEENDFEKKLDVLCDKIEIDGEIFYKEKEKNDGIHISYPTSNMIGKEENIEAVEIVNKILSEYLKQYAEESYPEEKRVEKYYRFNVYNLYYTNQDNTYIKGQDITAVINFCGKPVNGESTYWKENFSKNEFWFEEIDEQYIVNTYFFVRLTQNLENNEYEIAYIGKKPENYEEKLEELKEKGIDLENLDIEKINNTSYDDEIEIIPSSTTDVTATNAKSIEYNSSQIEINKISYVIKIICIAFLVILTIILIKFRYKAR